jgi:membrane-bound lytic murein transglycosylase D
MKVLVSVAALVALLVAAPSAMADDRYHPALDPRTFPVPPSLRPNIDFWRAIFSKYTSTQTVIHDNRALGVVFEVVSVDDLVRAGASATAVEQTMRDRVADATERYVRILRRLAGASDEAIDAAVLGRVRAMYEDGAGPAEFAAAAERVRGQRGLADHFQEAVRRSGQYMAGIEQILAKHGLPRQIQCLPFVESMFNDRARSKVGASGIWQFTRDTGRRYVRIDEAVDARHDVWLATDGAARLLRDNFAKVSSWPLALTGYNHGITGIQRAVRQLGTADMGQIAARYDSRSFGFASRNFYTEFLAAVIVYTDRETLFPALTPRPTVVFDEFVPTRFVSLLDLASVTKTDVDALAKLNPALSSEVSRGALLVPAGYPLRVPVGTRAEFQRAFGRLPAERTLPTQARGIKHRVTRGETLAAVANRYGTSVAALRAANGIAADGALRSGQVLTIRTGSTLSPLVWSPPASGPAAVFESARVHIVQAGETLYQIATRYGLTVSSLVSANDRISADRLLVGMQLAIPLTKGR